MTYIKKINIENFKWFKGKFSLTLNQGLNILVGNNDAWKTTILEAIHLALTGLYRGKYLKTDISQYLFNADIVQEYIHSLNEWNTPQPPPKVFIEIFMEWDDIAKYEGIWNSEKIVASGFKFEISFDENYQEEYEELLKQGEFNTLPIEYYKVLWSDFSWLNSISSRMVPLKSAFIDASNHLFNNGSDMYIARIIQELLTTQDRVAISQAHRKMTESFMLEKVIEDINTKIQEVSQISDKKVKISAELSSKNAWENSLMTYLDNIPFHYIWKGEQCIIKTKLALGHKKAKEANILLLEEPENHLSYSKLNELIRGIDLNKGTKQILISTHSSFVANKLWLENLIFLNNNKYILKFNDLPKNTYSFFKKISGYDTLRLILSKRAILVEWPSDELIVQRAFYDKNGSLPIEHGVDVISVGTSFLNFLDIATHLHIPISVVTDNDGNVEAVRKKYSNYLGENKKKNIKICFDDIIDTGEKNDFNYNTLEPKILKDNALELLNNIFQTEYKKDRELLNYMHKNKTTCALKIFETDKKIKFPNYILNAISDNEE